VHINPQCSQLVKLSQVLAPEQICR
jgi:hypothetical protein